MTERQSLSAHQTAKPENAGTGRGISNGQDCKLVDLFCVLSPKNREQETAGDVSSQRKSFPRVAESFVSFRGAVSEDQTMSQKFFLKLFTLIAVLMVAVIGLNG